MSAWTAAADTILEGDIVYVTTRPLVWHVGVKDGPVYTVPAGFRFEASIPVGLRWLFNPHRLAFRKAAALHDHMCRAGWSRLTSAGEFYTALKADGVTPTRRLVMFIAVSVYRSRA